MREITPPHLACSLGGCPATFRDNDDLIVIGAIEDKTTFPHRDRIGHFEEAVRIKGYFRKVRHRDHLEEFRISSDLE